METAKRRAADSAFLLEDMELARRCARGDEASLRRVFEGHEPALRRILFRILGNLQDAEEVTAETFIRFWRSANRFRGECSLRAFLSRIAVNLARDRIRRRQPVTECLHDLPMSEESACSHQSKSSAGPSDRLMETIRSGFLMLLPEERELLTLYYLEDLEYEEICGVLGIGYDVLRTRLVRARKHLREIVGNENGK